MASRRIEAAQLSSRAVDAGINQQIDDNGQTPFAHAGMTTVLIAGETAREEQVTGEELAAVVDAVASAPLESELRRSLPELWAELCPFH